MNSFPYTYTSDSSTQQSIRHSRTDGLPICYDCVFNPRNCGNNDNRGSSLHPSSCFGYTQKQVKCHAK